MRRLEVHFPRIVNERDERRDRHRDVMARGPPRGRAALMRVDDAPLYLAAALRSESAAAASHEFNLLATCGLSMHLPPQIGVTSHDTNTGIRSL